MSEFGFQSFPQIETVDSYTIPSDRDIESKVMLAHQRHPRGNQLIREYMLREYPMPKDFESFLYVSQVLQAEGIKIGAEHFRRIRPRNMGSLYWQIDDCWPVASWSSIDYYGEWKALQYYSRKFYDKLLVSPREEDGNLEFYVVSDERTATPAKLNVVLMDFDGNVLTSASKDLTIAPLESRSYLSLPVKTWLEGKDTGRLMLFCELLVNGKSLSSNEYFFEPYKNLSIPKPNIAADVVRTHHGFKITLSSDKFAKAVYLSSGSPKGFFSDNYFDLLPGRKAVVEFNTREAGTVNDFRENLKIRSMVDAF
jgi:beta-mannosidase